MRLRWRGRRAAGQLGDGGRHGHPAVQQQQEDGRLGHVPEHSNLTSNDSVTVTVTRTAQLLRQAARQEQRHHPGDRPRDGGDGHHTRAKLRCHALGRPKQDYVFPGVPLYTNSPNNANNGAVSLPYQNGVNCPPTSGASDYRDEIAGVLNPCAISVGEIIDEKTGNNTGPTAQA
jgi:hypothetical protein